VKIAESITWYFWFCAKYDTPRLLRSPPSQEGNYGDQASLIGFLGESPLERGASSVVKMEEAGCVKIRISGWISESLAMCFYLL
jgi:hypothetical protein